MSFVFLSCKKYNDDKFYSTYTVEKRFVIGNPNWTLTSYFDGSNTIKVDSSNYGLIFTEDTVWISFMNLERADEDILGAEIHAAYGGFFTPLSEFIAKKKWKLTNNKETLFIQDVGEFQINKLSVSEMIIQDYLGHKYTFNKIKFNTSDQLTKSIFDIPLFGINEGYSEISDYIKCESLSDLGHNSNASLWKGICEFSPKCISYPNSSSANFFQFNSNFSQTGYFTFWTNNNSNPVVTINNSAVSAQLLKTYDTGSYDNWKLYRVNVASTGNKSIVVTNCQKIDEIRFWQFD